MDADFEDRFNEGQEIPGTVFLNITGVRQAFPLLPSQRAPEAREVDWQIEELPSTDWPLYLMKLARIYFRATSATQSHLLADFMQERFSATTAFEFLLTLYDILRPFSNLIDTAFVRPFHVQRLWEHLMGLQDHGADLFPAPPPSPVAPKLLTVVADTSLSLGLTEQDSEFLLLSPGSSRTSCATPAAPWPSTSTA